MCGLEAKPLSDLIESLTLGHHELHDFLSFLLLFADSLRKASLGFNLLSFLGSHQESLFHFAFYATLRDALLHPVELADK